jgi:hypothetical protein
MAWQATGLTTLEVRRVRGDLIQMYKIQKGIEEVNWVAGPKRAPHTQTRSASLNEYRLERELYPSKDCNDFRRAVTVRQEFFLNRVCGAV